MKVYRIKRTQILHCSLDVAWKFFSTPSNLHLITPGYMNFRILYRSGDDKLYAGQVIHYKVCIVPGLPVDWHTVITQAQEPVFFIDEQRSGPFKMWHHQHSFRKTPEGVEVTDEVNYAIPLGLIGRIANAVFVGKTVNAIFDYRSRVLEELFKNKQNENLKSA